VQPTGAETNPNEEMSSSNSSSSSMGASLNRVCLINTQITLMIPRK
jgi:hypothetical protein